MRKVLLTVLAASALIVTGCQKNPGAKHVILIGFDAMSAIGLQRAETPTFNYMIENGAVSIDTRCCRETSSSENWFAMVSAAPLEVHGVTTNNWQVDSYSIEPPVKNRLGIFPTVFDAIREQKPDARMEAYIEWDGMTRMFDMGVFDKTLYSHGDKSYTDKDVMDEAFKSYLENEPDFMFVGVDVTDHAGHVYGHERQGFFDTIHEMDSRVGAFLKELESRDMLKDLVIIITADHGGINYGHGGDSMAELQIPVIMYGKGVTKGKFMETTHMIYDVGATVAGLLGVELPGACRGQFISEAFEPKTSACYVPTPLVHPFKGLVPDGEKVAITADFDGAEIYYTLDGSKPTNESIKYEGPFELTENSYISAVAYKNGNYSGVAGNYLVTATPAGEAAIQYKLYRNYMDTKLPDFTKFGHADAVGYTGTFSVDEIPVQFTEDHFAVIFSSNLKISEAGRYKFCVASDDGSKLIIDDKVVVNNDGSHSLNTVYGAIDLTEGSHIIKVEYFEDTDGQILDVSFGKEGAPLLPLTSAVLEK